MVRRCLKGVAVALIVLPEPVTTALGVAMLAVLLIMSRPKKLSDLGDLEALVKKSLRNTALSESCLYFLKIQTPVFHALKVTVPQQPVIVKYQAIPNQSWGNKWAVGGMESPELETGRVHVLKKYVPSSEAASWFDNRKVSETVLHHTLRTSLPQYEANSSTISALKRPAVKKVSKVQPHTLAKTVR
jgi:hypothetical protein